MITSSYAAADVVIDEMFNSMQGAYMIGIRLVMRVEFTLKRIVNTDIFYHFSTAKLIFIRNNFCKGFIIPEKFIVEPEYINILNKYSPKNVLMAKSAYMAAFKIAKLNAQNFNAEIIILAGTDDIEEIKFKLSLSFFIHFFQKRQCVL